MRKFLFVLFLCVGVALISCSTEDEIPIFGDVYGTITDSKSGEPIRNAEIILSPGNRTTVSGSDGHFEFKSLEAGQYKISVSANEYTSNSRQITIIPGQSVICDIHLSAKSIAEMFKISSTDIDFGSTQTQLSITMTNNSNNEAEWSLNLGDNPWLTASPIAGRIASGGTQAIVFTANRASIVEEIAGVISITALNNTIPITVTCSPSQQVSSIMEVEPLDIDFGTQSTEQIIRIKNKSAANLNWTIYQIREKSLSVSDTSGTIQPGNAKVVAIKLDRSQVTEDIATSFMISDGTTDQPINVIIRSTSQEDSGKTGKLALPENTINFGYSNDVQTFIINNEGDASLEWQIADIQHPDVIKCTPESGSIPANASTEISVELDRSKWDSETLESSFYVTDGINKYGVDVLASFAPEYNYENVPNNQIWYKGEGEPDMACFGGALLERDEQKGEYRVLTFDEDLVTIDDNAFANRDLITSVLLPKSIKTIGYRAFYNTHISTFRVPDNVTTIKSGAFINNPYLSSFTGKYASEDGRCLIIDNVLHSFAPADLTSYDIPEGVTAIGSEAFRLCKSLTNINFPNSVLAIDKEAFRECSRLKRITIPESVETIGESVFNSCEALVEITLSEGIKTIGAYAFANCGKFTELTLPNSITTIGQSAFESCKRLEKVNLGSDLERIGEYAFKGCIKLNNVTVPSNVKAIGRGVFLDCSELSEIVFESMTPPALGGDAFANTNENLKIYVPDGAYSAYVQAEGFKQYEANIVNSDSFYTTLLYTSTDDNIVSPNNEDGFDATIVSNTYEDGQGTITFSGQLTSIGENAFRNCTTLSTVDITEGVTTIGKEAFAECSNLTSVDIPAGVVSIGNAAFHSCSSLTSVDIPESTVSIGDRAFWDCNSLESINTSQGITSFGVEAFALCKSLTHIVIPEGITSISHGLFYDCVNLMSVTIPESVTSIEQGAFVGCGSLSSIDIPEGVTSIGNEAFVGCASLTSITIPDGITSIGSSTFLRCNNLKSINIPSSVTSIGVSAFEDCLSLQSITIPQGVKSIADRTFYACGKMTSITIPEGVTSIGGEAFWVCYSLQSIDIPESVTTIDGGAFRHCSGITSITIPEKVSSIGQEAFANCGSLALIECKPTTPPSLGVNAFNEVNANCMIYVPDSAYDAYIVADGWVDYEDMIVNTNPTVKSQIYYTTSDGNIVNVVNLSAFDANIVSNVYEDGQGVITFDRELTTIGECAFIDCGNLTSVNIPEGVTSLGGGAFRGCSSLASTTIPESVKSIGDSAFWGCGSLKSITIPQGVTVIEASTFEGCESLTSITIPEGITFIEGAAFKRCKNLKSINIPSSVTSIGVSAFEDCLSLQSITIPQGVKSIADRTFYACGKMTSITIPEGVTSIGGEAFWLSGLQSVELPQTIKTIGGGAFMYCGGLTSITIPENVTSIGKQAFNRCGNLALVNCKPTTPPLLGADAFNEVNANCMIYVPDSAYDAYIVADGWVDYEYMIVNTNPTVKSQISYTTSDGNIVNVVNLSAFDANIVSNVYEDGQGVITFDRELTTIGEDAFIACSNLISVNIPDGVTTIGKSAFYNCGGLMSITIPNGITSIGQGAFCGCGSLMSITIPKEVTSIGNDAFVGCASLTSITIPDGITSIGSSTFLRCNNLKSINIPSSVTSIGEKAFEGCHSLQSITIPQGVKSIADRTFYGCGSMTSITIPKGVTSIGGDAFWGCNNLSLVDMPQSLISIAGGAFMHCGGLTSITIPEKVTSIGREAFANCGSLALIDCKPTTPPLLGANNFNNVAKYCVIYVPDNAYSAYTAAAGWADYKDIMVNTSQSFQSRIYYTSSDGNIVKPVNLNAFDANIVSNVYENGQGIITFNIKLTTLGENAFWNTENIKSINIPDGVTSIGPGALSSCRNLTSVSIPESVTTIGKAALASCSNLTAISIPDKVTSIGSSVFSGCSNLKSVNIPDGITLIDEHTFENCSSLSSIVIPESVTSIKQWAFAGCRSMTSITIPSKVTSIEYCAFNGCSQLASIYCKPIVPPAIGQHIFLSIAANYSIFVPTVSLNEYQSKWNEYISIIKGYEF